MPSCALFGGASWSLPRGMWQRRHRHRDPAPQTLVSDLRQLIRGGQRQRGQGEDEQRRSEGQEEVERLVVHTDHGRRRVRVGSGGGGARRRSSSSSPASRTSRSMEKETRRKYNKNDYGHDNVGDDLSSPVKTEDVRLREQSFLDNEDERSRRSTSRQRSKSPPTEDLKRTERSGELEVKRSMRSKTSPSKRYDELKTEDFDSLSEDDMISEELERISSASDSHSSLSLTPSPEPRPTSSASVSKELIQGNTLNQFTPRNPYFRSRSRGSRPTVGGGARTCSDRFSKPPPMSGKQVWEAKVEAFISAITPNNDDQRKRSLDEEDSNCNEGKPKKMLKEDHEIGGDNSSTEKEGGKASQVKSSSNANEIEGAEHEKESQTEDDEPKFTALAKFIASQLDSSSICPTGIFRPPLLSLLSPQEWISLQTLTLLAEAGYKESTLYFMATTKSGGAFESELKSLVFKGRLREVNGDPQIMAMVLKVIEIIVKYHTSKDERQDQDHSMKEEDGHQEEDKNGEDHCDSSGSSNVVRQGIGATLKALSTPTTVAQETSTAFPSPLPPSFHPSIPPPSFYHHPHPPPSSTLTPHIAQSAFNHWTHIEDSMLVQSLKSLAELKTFLAKDLLRLSDPTLCSPNVSAFDTAQLMVVALVLAGYSYNSLRHMVSVTPQDKLYPDANKKGLATKVVFGARKGNVSLFEQIVARLKQMKRDVSDLSDAQREYAVRKMILFFVRGLEKSSNNSAAMTSTMTSSATIGNNKKTAIVYNFLPPGIREEEQSGRVVDEGLVVRSQDDKDGNDDDVVDHSTDPLHAIIQPSNTEPITTTNSPNNKGNELPNQRYQVCALHLEWLLLKGRPQVYELSLYSSDHDSLTLYAVPNAEQQVPEPILEKIGFVANPERNEHYFVQLGLGVIKASNIHRAVERVASFLETKRNLWIGDDNRNNGLILLLNTNDDVAVISRLLEQHTQKSLMLDTVKGFASIENLSESKEFLSWSGPRMETGETTVDEKTVSSTFYHSTVKRDSESKNLVAKSKGESLFQAIEFLLNTEQQDVLQSLLRPFAWPSFSSVVLSLQRQMSVAEQLYPIEVFIAAKLQEESSRQEAVLRLEGPFASPFGSRELRDKASVVASRFCRLLVQQGFDRDKLRAHFVGEGKTMAAPKTVLTSNLFLDKLSVSQRLSVADQTVRCLHALRAYYHGNELE